jgi:hypothetical protein
VFYDRRNGSFVVRIVCYSYNNETADISSCTFEVNETCPVTRWDNVYALIHPSFTSSRKKIVLKNLCNDVTHRPSSTVTMKIRVWSCYKPSEPWELACDWASDKCLYAERERERERERTGAMLVEVSEMDIFLNGPRIPGAEGGAALM